MGLLIPLAYITVSSLLLKRTIFPGTDRLYTYSKQIW